MSQLGPKLTFAGIGHALRSTFFQCQIRKPPIAWRSISKVRREDLKIQTGESGNQLIRFRCNPEKRPEIKHKKCLHRIFHLHKQLSFK